MYYFQLTFLFLSGSPSHLTKQVDSMGINLQAYVRIDRKGTKGKKKKMKEKGNEMGKEIEFSFIFD